MLELKRDFKESVPLGLYERRVILKLIDRNFENNHLLFKVRAEIKNMTFI